MMAATLLCLSAFAISVVKSSSSISALEEYTLKGVFNGKELIEALMKTDISTDEEKNWEMLDLLSVEDTQYLMQYLVDSVREFAPVTDTDSEEYQTELKAMVAKHLANENRAIDPVVFIPGFLASGLNCHKRRVTTNRFCPGNRPDYQCWLSIPKIVRLRCFAEEFSRTYTTGGKYGYKLDYPDFSTDGIDFGGIDGIESMVKFLGIPIMSGMIEAFEAVGYVADVSFRGATYDFTFTGNVYSDDDSVQAFHAMLKDLVEETYRINGNKKVNLIGHSMGTIQGHWFLSSGYVDAAWKNTYIKNMIDLTPLYKGAPLAHRALLTGLTPIPLVKWYLRTLITNWGAVHAFMPFNWNGTAFVITDSRSYDDVDTVDLYLDAEKPHIADAYPYSHSVLARMTPHGVPYHCFICTNITTECGVDYRGTGAPDTWYETPASIPCDGDVLVPTTSSSSCQQLNPITYGRYEGVNHLSILNHIPLLDVLISITTA